MLSLVYPAMKLKLLGTTELNLFMRGVLLGHCYNL